MKRRRAGGSIQRFGLALLIGGGENLPMVERAIDRTPMLLGRNGPGLVDGSSTRAERPSKYTVDLQVARWLSTRLPIARFPPGVWHPGWLMDQLLRPGNPHAGARPASQSSDHRHAIESTPVPPNTGAVAGRPEFWAPVPPRIKAEFWAACAKHDTVALMSLVARAPSQDRDAGAVTVGAVEQPVPVVATAIAQATSLPAAPQHRTERPEAERVTSHPARPADRRRATARPIGSAYAHPERRDRRGRKHGRAWAIEKQLVTDLIAGVVDIRAPRPKVAAHARALLAAMGIRCDVDYSRSQLDRLVVSAIEIARAHLVRAPEPDRRG